MTITALTDPAQLPSQDDDQQTFDNKMAAMIRNFPLRAQQENELAANLNSIAAGGAYAIPFKFDTALTQLADPGAGKLRLNTAALDQATSITLSTYNASSQLANAYEQSMAESSSAVKGHIRISSLDGSRYAVYAINSMTANTAGGYNAFGITHKSSANPVFSANELLMLSFTRTGDKGDKGDNGFSNMVVIRSTQNWTPPAGVFKAEITVIDGGQGGAMSSSGAGAAGQGGTSSVSIRTLNPAVTYTANIGGSGAGATSNGSGGAGGASSFSGSGLTTLTTSNGDLVVAGGRFGDTLYAATVASTIATAPGQGGLGGATSGTAGSAGAVGAIIIKY